MYVEIIKYEYYMKLIKTC